MISRLSFIAAAVLVPFAIACSAGESPDTGSDDQDMTLAPESVTITQEQNGETINALVGQKIILELPVSDEGDDAAYQWRIVSTDRTFGYAQESLIETLPAKQSFTWTTGGPLNVVGKHTVKLAYGEEGGSVKDTFEFTVDIVENSVPHVGP